MLRAILFGTVGFLAGSAAIAVAGPKEDVQSATKKLADSPNYSWTSTTEGGFPGGGPVEGKTQKDGLTYVKLMMRNEPLEILKQGDKVALNVEGEWESAADLEKDLQGGPPPGGPGGPGGAGGPPPGGRGPGGPGVGPGGPGGGFNPMRMILRMAQNVTLPAAQAEELVSKVKDFQQADGVYTAEIPEDAAKELLSFRPQRGGRGGPGGPGARGQGQGQGGPGGGAAAAGGNAGPGGNGGPGGPGGGRGFGPPPINNAKGTLKVWTKDGVVTKYQYTLTGTLSFNGEDRDLNRTTTVDLKDIGSTKIDVPDSAKAKVK